MFLMVEVVMELKNIFVLNLAIVVDVFQKLDFIDGLVVVVFVVLDDLQADELAVGEVHALDGLGEGS